MRVTGGTPVAADRYQERIMDDYGRRIILDVPFELAVAETSQVLREEGFEVLARFDVRDYLARTLHHECRRYLLFEALVPELTLEALQHDPGIGAILPVTIAVYELADGESAVVASPALAPVLSDFGWRAAAPALATIGDHASERLAQALDRLQTMADHSPPVVQS
jgi:uncharacterized protein (DUF302 family)